MKEAVIQAQIVSYLRAILPKQYRVVAVPNASLRTRTGRAGNAVAGLTPGVPDLVIFGDGSAFFIEVKAKRGTLSDAQSEWANWCIMTGCMAWCCARSVDDVRKAIEQWKLPTREVRQ